MKTILLVLFFFLFSSFFGNIEAQVWMGSNIPTATNDPVTIGIVNPNTNSTPHLLIRRNQNVLPASPYVDQHYLRIENLFAGFPPAIPAVTTPILTINDKGYLGLGIGDPTSPLHVAIRPAYNQKSFYFMNKATPVNVMGLQDLKRQFFYVNRLYQAAYGLTPRTDDQGIFWSDGNDVQQEQETQYTESGEANGQISVTKYYNTSSGFVIAPWYKPIDPTKDFRGLRMDADGNVSIGYYQTFATNGIANRLAVNGTITCKEINMDVTYTWPDYVFSNTYKLLSLDSLGTYILKNGHLPNMPTACQVPEHGYQLGQMQQATLEKLEELTLYIIEMNKRLIALEEQNKLLQAQLMEVRK